jgi:alanine racemase
MADLDTGPAPADRSRLSAPVARVLLRAITRNTRIAVAAHGSDPGTVADLRADARGHGVARVAAAVLEAGAATVRVDDEAASALRTLVPAHRVSTTAVATLHTATLFGLPDAMAGAVPALRLTGTVLAVKALRRGEGVSYGYTHRAARDTRVALVTGGYAQGIVRGLGGRADVLIGGDRLPIVGRVAMDVCVVDIGDSAVTRGDSALFLGDAREAEPSLAEWATATGLTAGELVTAVGLHAVRRYAP